METNRYYRAPWTSGRYDERSKSAIFYNLISGEAAFFRSISASFIGRILRLDRSSAIDWERLRQEFDIDALEIVDFLNALVSAGLLTTSHPDALFESEYRNIVATQRRNGAYIIQSSVPDESMHKSNAELEYFEAVKRKGGITSVMFELTYRCGEKCIHCYNPGAERNESDKNTRNRFIELDFTDYKRIIDDLYDHGLVKACITGGDPFSNKDAWDILRYLYEKGIATDVYTNGQSIHTKAKDLAALYPRTVGVSIYSSDCSVHDAITRVKGSWKKSMSLLNQLSDLAVPLNVKCCIMRPNVKSYRGILNLAKALGAQPQFEVNIRESNDGDICAKRLRLTKDELRIVLMDKNIPYNLPEDVDEYKERKCDLERNTCMIGVDDFSINPAGDVQPCVAFPMPFGNMKTHSWDEIMDNNPRFEDWRSCKMKEYDKCGNYPYCSCCKPCAGLNFIEHGDFRKAAETSCYMAKMRYELLEALSRGEDLLKGNELDVALNNLPDYYLERLSREYYHKDNDVSL